MEDMIEIPVEQAQKLGVLVTAVRDWRGGLIPNTSTGLWGPTQKLLAAIAALDRAPCDHPRSWRVYKDQNQTADESCGYCGAVVRGGLTTPSRSDDSGDASPESDLPESSSPPL